MNILSTILSGGASKLVESIGTAVDNLTTSKEEKEALKIEIQKEVNRHTEAIQSEANKELDILLKDTASARDANARIQESEKASFWAKNTAYFLDVFIGLIWGTMTIFIGCKALKLVDNVNADMTAVLSLYSTVTAIFMINVNFHRGSSIGSQNKQKTIDNLTK